ncbi:hypothetical protein AAD018_015830 [Aestuariibius insulae]|uniref:hypothetical protein n=1 Tax=Aestuariibius insulae TaxID=2058287 RepID=UPI00345EF99A
MRVWFAICLAIWGGTLDAGPWPRGKGKAFVSVSSTFSLTGDLLKPIQYEPSLYAEYGVTERLTFGLDVFVAGDFDQPTAFVFGRLPILERRIEDPVAVTLGVGFEETPRGQKQLIRAGLAWGRGFERGWLAVDSFATIGLDGGDLDLKLDATWGRNFGKRWTTALQLQTGQTGRREDPFAKLAPSIILSIHDKARVELGIVHHLTDEDVTTAVKLGSWLEF